MRKLLVLSAALTAPSAFAQSPGITPALLAECRHVLVADVIRNASTENDFMHALNMVDETLYNRLKAGNETNIGFKGFELGNNYSEFQENRNSFFSKSDFTSISDYSGNYLSSRVPPEARDNWFKCIQTLALASNKSIGLYMYVEESARIPYHVKVGYRTRANDKQRIKSSAISDGFEKVGNVQRQTLFAPGDHLSHGNERTYYITPTDPNRPVTLTIELENNDKSGLMIYPRSSTPPADQQQAKVRVLQASQVSESTSTGVKNLNIDTTCGQDKKLGYVCSQNSKNPTRAVYDLRNNHVGLPDGIYVVDIEYSSDKAISGVSIQANEDQQLLNFPPTGGKGMNARNTIRTKLSFTQNRADLVVDRGGELPNIRGFTFTPVPQ